MKNIAILVLLAFNLVCYGQNEKVTKLTVKDFGIVNDQLLTNLKKTITVKDYSNNNNQVSFSFSSPKEKFDSLGVDKLNSILLDLRLATLLRVKNTYTCVFRQISIAFSEEYNEWIVMFKFTAVNDYGVIKEGKVFFLYNEKGEYIQSF